MKTMNPVFITSLGSFLPNEPVSNDQMEEILGQVNGKPSRVRRRILQSNGIKERYYALDQQGNVTHLNQNMAANAIRAALQRRGIQADNLSLLATGTTIPDTLMPGFASMVHGELGGHPMDIISSSGVCCASMAALKAAWQAVGCGEHACAATVGSERSSALMHASRFEQESQVAKTREGVDPSYQYFNADFLRWMLSDGAGAAILENKPNAEGLSLRIDWIKMTSYANEYPTCMYMGLSDPANPQPGKTWTSAESYQKAVDEGMMLIRQDVNLLNNNICKVAAQELQKHVENGLVDIDSIDHFLPHISSYYFHERLRQTYVIADINIPEEKWYTNLEDKGNIGSASIFVMLDEAFNSGRFKKGDKILVMVPESGRFSFCYAQLTCVDADDYKQELPEQQVNSAGVVNTITPFANYKPKSLDEIEVVLHNSPLGYEFAQMESPVTKWLASELAFVWSQFEQRLNQVPLIRRLENGTITLEDYKTWLLNLRQQVIDGGMWLSRTASNMSMELFELRSALIGHAREEHRDYQILERDYCNIGGTMEELQNKPKNIGSEALSAFIFDRANHPDPVDLLGAIFIIEGLGSHKVPGWTQKLRETLNLRDDQVRFLAYHGENDGDHYENLRKLLSAPFINYSMAKKIVKTAKVVGRLYALQLEELDNC